VLKTEVFWAHCTPKSCLSTLNAGPRVEPQNETTREVGNRVPRLGDRMFMLDAATEAGVCNEVDRMA